jgi:hypothetical protein
MCTFAAKDPPDPVELAWICSRSAATAATPATIQPVLPDVREAIEWVKGMKSCVYRSVNPGCGCSGGGRCSLRRGVAVNHQECFDCLRRYPDP